MTVIVRRFVSVPARSAAETWTAISDLLAPDKTKSGAQELASVAGTAASLIAREAMNSPIVLYGSGPRVRIYCVYNEDALQGDSADESVLPFDATSGDWRLSLPCPAEDLMWVQKALEAKSGRISARDTVESVDETEASKSGTDRATSVDMEAFFKS